jgi:hypothetical protein
VNLHAFFLAMKQATRGVEHAVPDNDFVVAIDGAHYAFDNLPIAPAAACFAASINQKQFDRLAQSIDVEFLQFKGLAANDLTFLNSQKRLRGLRLHNAPKLNSLKKIPALEVLSLDTCLKVTDLSPLAGRNLRSLSIEGGHSKQAAINSLEPIAQINGLEELRLVALRVNEGGLKPLAALSTLKSLQVSLRFPFEDYAYLKAKLPNVECENLRPHYPVGPNHVQVVGHRMPKLHSQNDTSRIKEYEDRFWKLVVKHSNM